MSKLIGDVGSTNADWVYLSDTGNKEFFRTKGYNPYIHTIEPFTNVKFLAFFTTSKLCRLPA